MVNVTTTVCTVCLIFHTCSHIYIPYTILHMYWGHNEGHLAVSEVQAVDSSTSRLPGSVCHQQNGASRLLAIVLFILEVGQTHTQSPRDGHFTHTGGHLVILKLLKDTHSWNSWLTVGLSTIYRLTSAILISAIKLTAPMGEAVNR